MKKYQIMGDLIAGAMSKEDLQKLVETLTKMGKTAMTMATAILLRTNCAQAITTGLAKIWSNYNGYHA